MGQKNLQEVMWLPLELRQEPFCCTVLTEELLKNSWLVDTRIRFTASVGIILEPPCSAVQPTEKLWNGMLSRVSSAGIPTWILCHWYPSFLKCFSPCSQWKVDKSPIFRMAVLQDNQTLVTGGHSIQCWNVTNHSVTTTFTGHTNNVTCLVPVHMAGEKGGYFLSAAESDRSISAW